MEQIIKQTLIHTTDKQTFYMVVIRVEDMKRIEDSIVSEVDYKLTVDINGFMYSQYVRFKADATEFNNPNNDFYNYYKYGIGKINVIECIKNHYISLKIIGFDSYTDDNKVDLCSIADCFRHQSRLESNKRQQYFNPNN